MKKAYPVLIKKNADDYLVYIPDMDIYTEAKTFPDAIEMSRDAIGLKGIDYEDENTCLPEPSRYDDAIAKAVAEADNLFNYSDGILTYVDVDFTAYRYKIKNKAVKKNCTIPYWLNEAAEKKGINFSKVLQDALTEIIANSNCR